MADQRTDTLFSFKVDELNKFIKKKDKIRYNKITLDLSDPKRGLHHIRERHIDQVVELFYSLYLSNIPEYERVDPIDAYIDDRNLSESFKEYYNLLNEVSEDIEELSNEVFGTKKNDFRKAFYALNIQKAKDYYSSNGENDPRKVNFDEKIDENYAKLKKTRSLLNENEIEEINLSIVDLLSSVAGNPQKIWKDRDSHIYVSEFKVKSNQRFIFFVAEDNGNLFTAYFKKPNFKRVEGMRYVIYPQHMRGK